MKTIIVCIITSCFIFPIAIAQSDRSSLSRSTEETEIIGKLLDGTSSDSVAEKQLPDYEVKGSHRVQQGGRVVTVNEVEKPLPVVKVTKNQIEENQAEIVESAISRAHVFVSAITYDNKTTLVKWGGFNQAQEDALVCWSNVDWAYFEGFSTFKARGQEFTFMVLRESSTLKDLREARRGNNNTDKFKALRQLPNLRATGARYVMVSDNDKANARSEQMMDFMEGIHDLYDAKEKELEAARIEREKQSRIREEERKKNSPKPEDMTLLFWNNDESPKK